jgi:uncharacterized protein YbbC (DUF1343 family)
MRKPAVLCLTLLLLWPTLAGVLATPPAHTRFRLGNEVFLERYLHLVAGKRVGLITNQSGVNSRGQSLIDLFSAEPGINLRALYAPEHGIDGKAAAGAYVASYTHPVLRIPVYSLYGATRRPTPAMLADVDVLVFDMQDIGARTYTFISTMNYAMAAAREHGIPFIVLDRPNPLGGVIVEGPVLEEGFQTFLGVDILPLAHGMTIGELARYFNRLIGAELTVVPMEGYTREMLFQDTGLTWVQTSPNIPNLASVFGYLATGLASGSGVVQGDRFTWVGGAGLQSARFAALLNGAGLAGATFTPEDRGALGGARLTITDYRQFNPARTGMHMLFLARSQWQFPVPRSGPAPNQLTMFDRHMGGSQVARWLEENLSPQAVESRYQAALQAFRKVREQYLIYGFRGEPAHPALIVNGQNVHMTVRPFIANDRTLVPVRVLAQKLGAQVTWVGTERAVVIQGHGATMRLVIGSDQAVVNGSVYRMDTAPIIRQDRAMLPVRFVSERLGARVDWCRVTHAVVVTTADTRR